MIVESNYSDGILQLTQQKQQSEYAKALGFSYGWKTTNMGVVTISNSKISITDVVKERSEYV
jgi:hypothetical protein